VICRSEGLVIRGYRMSESSKVAVIYTREHGKIRFAARGARRPKSKFGASLEPITEGAFVYYRRENRELQTLGEADILYAYTGIKQDYDRLAYASGVCDLLDIMTADEDRNDLLYSVAVDALRWLEQVPKPAVEVPLWYFELRAAAALGYRPHLSGCVRCGGRVPDGRVRFSASLGGTLCGRCGGQGLPLRRATVGFLEQLQTRRPPNVELSGFQTEGRAEARRALRQFLDYHLPARRRIRALDFLDRLQAAEAGRAYGSAPAEEGVN
jgi:DNA repair protein RecO (recombination protein O)